MKVRLAGAVVAEQGKDLAAALISQINAAQRRERAEALG